MECYLNQLISCQYATNIYIQMRRMLVRAQLCYQLKVAFCTFPTPYQLVRYKLIKFPYSHLTDKMPAFALTGSESDFLSTCIAEHYKAFAALKKDNLQSNEQRTILLTEATSSNDQLVPNNSFGSTYFIKYFTSKFPEIQKALQSSKDEEQISYNLKILFYLHHLQKPKPNFDRFGLSKIELSGTLAQKAYLLQLYQERPQYLQYAEKFYQQFSSASEEEKLKTAFVVISIPNSKEYLSPRLHSACIKVLSNYVKDMDRWAMFRCLELIFETRFPETREFLEICTKHVLDHLDQQSKVKMPILYKIMKARSKLGMSNKSFENYITENSEKFKSIFLKPKVNKQSLLNAISSQDGSRILPVEINKQFVAFILTKFQDFVDADACDSDEMIETVKMSLKYIANFNNIDKSTLANLLEEKLIPLYQHEKMVLFWLLILLFRFNLQLIQKDSIQKLTFQVLEFYDRQYRASTTNAQKHLNVERIIQIHYHLFRSRIRFNYKSILDYDYKYVQNFQSLYNTSIVFKSVDLAASQKYQIVRKMLPRIESLLQEGKVNSIKHLFSFMGLVDSAKCQQSMSDASFRFIFYAFEQALIRIYSNQKSTPTYPQLIYIKKIFIRNSQPQQFQRTTTQPQRKILQKTHFISFLDQCIKDPANFQKSLISYQKKVGSNRTPSYNRNNKVQP